MVIKISKHFINKLLTLKSLIKSGIYEKLKRINKKFKILKKRIQMFDNVNKNLVFQCKFKNVQIAKYDLNIKKLLTLNT